MRRELSRTLGKILKPLIGVSRKAATSFSEGNNYAWQCLEQSVLAAIEGYHATLDDSRLEVLTLFHDFVQMLRHRRGEELDQWLASAFHSGITELRSFVHKLRHDQAGLVLKWNNGMVEGHVIA